MTREEHRTRVREFNRAFEEIMNVQKLQGMTIEEHRIRENSRAFEEVCALVRDQTMSPESLREEIKRMEYTINESIDSLSK